MEEYINYLKEPAFLVGVIVTIISGLFFILITPKIQTIQAKIQKKRNSRILQKQKLKRNRVIKLQRNLENRNSNKLDSLYHLLTSACILILGIALVQLLDPMLNLLHSTYLLEKIGYNTVYIFIWVITLFIFTQGIIKFRKGIFLRDIISLAEKRERLLKSYSKPAKPTVNVIESFLDPKFKNALAEFDYNEFGISPKVDNNKKNNEQGIR